MVSRRHDHSKQAISIIIPCGAWSVGSGNILPSTPQKQDFGTTPLDALGWTCDATLHPYGEQPQDTCLAEPRKNPTDLSYSFECSWQLRFQTNESAFTGGTGGFPDPERRKFTSASWWR